MITKKVQYNDPFTGAAQVAELHFHFNKNDILQLEAEATSVPGSTDASLSDRLTRIMGSGNNEAILNEFKRLILAAYGKRQGSRFVKGPDISADFAYSEEFSEFLFQLLSSEEEATEFFNGLVNTSSAQRAPLLSDIQNEGIKGPNGLGDDLPTQNVFEQEEMRKRLAADGLEPGVPATPETEESSELVNPDEAYPHDRATQEASGRGGKKIRKLQKAEMERMTYSQVIKGVEDGKWTLPDSMK